MADVMSTELLPQAELTDEVVAFARLAARDEAGTDREIGEYIGAVTEDTAAVTASFSAVLPGYSGWRWSVTLAQPDPDDGGWTISEVVLLPGPDALLAPAWMPWDQRVRQGDLGVGDLLPTTEDDERLVPAYLQSDDPAIDEVAMELGFGRVRVLGRDGRADVAERWHDGSFGPGDEMALAAPGRCGTCGYFLSLRGSLGGMFGACGNELAPADGRVVDVEYGCGAHSEAALSALRPIPMSDVVIDELMLEVHQRPDTGEAADPSEGLVDITDTDTGGLADLLAELLPSILVLEAGPQPVAMLTAPPQLAALEAGTAGTTDREPDDAALREEPTAGVDPA